MNIGTMAKSIFIMKTKIISTLLFIGIAVIVPLLGKPHLLMHWRTGVVVAAIALLMFTQPPVATVRATSKDDRHTLWLILGLSIISVAAPIVEWAWFRDNPEATDFPSIAVLGMLLLVAGCAFRLWAIAKLGKWFTTEVKIQPEQPLITSGPYRVVRHPSYLGAYMAFLGLGLVFDAPIGMAFAALCMFWAYRNRIMAEEAVLSRHFGETWLDYAHSRKRLLPAIW